MNASDTSHEIRWAINPCSWRQATSLSQELGIPQVAAMVLAGRGLCDPGAAREFLECSFSLPDPFLFADMQGAVRTLLTAVDQGRNIIVHGDYDADGITATALLVLGLRALGANVGWYLPSRFNEGYGLSRTAVEAIVAREAAVLVTVDCGVNYPEEVALAQESGLEVVVVDHHEPGPRLPECHLIHHVKGEYPHGDLCGVGLALKLMHALHIERLGAERHKLPAGLTQSLDLVAIGTVADLAALKGENRYYVREGLKLLNLGQRVGLRALAEVSSSTGAIDSGTVAFRLAPRLNAAGRLADPSPPLKLLLTEDEAEARSLAGDLHEMNGARQDLERAIVEAAQRQVASLAALPTVLVLAAPDWHEGVVGIVASRMVEQYHRPTVLLGIRDGVAKGSGRSIPGYDLLGGLTACGHLLSIYGGHAQAAGLTMEVEKLDSFRAALQAHADAAVSPDDLVPRYRADAVLTAEELSVDTAQALARLEPFGCGNPRPRLLLVDTVLQNVERTRNGLHVKCRAQVGGVSIPAIGFGMGRALDMPAEGAQSVVGAQVRADEWQGAARAQLVLERVAAVQGGAGGQTDCAPACALADHKPGSPSGVGLHALDGSSECVGAYEWPSSARDLRGHPGRLTAVAQVLATQESTVVFTTSAAKTVELLDCRLPLVTLSGREIACVNRACEQAAGESVSTSKLAIVEWDAGRAMRGALQGRAHVIVFDPPFRASHIGMVSELADAGACLHLLYGAGEQKDTSGQLRYLAHPRFAMVCLYKAMQHTKADSADLFSVATRIAWQQAQVALTEQDLSRAQAILVELGMERMAPGKAKLDARDNAAYREAEAEYEECVRLCLTL